ncbi:MAG: hypothetical protein CVT92_14030 [Bacteroidetes bacterium HGW-Bacteroidetes-1]|jgi:hypothetical protein|nr:MAG: hypothetical protein CVT92_14030 [Bacteroidetes bacterium HGW-Bacteroidetes-1]
MNFPKFLIMKKNYALFAKGKRIVMLSMVILSIMLFGLSSMAQTIDLGRSASQVQVTEDNFQKTKVIYTYSALNSFGVESDRGMFNEVSIPGSYWTGDLGTPKLPASKHLIEIPFGADVSIKVLNFNMSEYKLSDFGIDNPIMPVQPSVRKDQSLEDIIFEYQEKLYQKDAFVSPEIASIEVLGVMRSYRIARITVAPVSYNPVQGIIRVYNDIEVEVTYNNADKSLTDYIKASTYSPYFEAIKNKLLNNPNRDYPQHPDLTKYPIKYLIVSDRMFENDLAPFIEWKTQKGFNVIVAYTDVIGTSYTQIQSYVHAQYNAGTPEDPAPSFVLFVGDTPQIPATQGSSSAKMTDLYYGSIDGDYFPEMYYGRFSARNSGQLIPQIEKTLYYEKYQFSDPTYLNNTTLIAGADGTWNPAVGQPTVHYGTQNYFNSANGFATVNTYLTSPYTGCYSPEKIAVGFINYTAHCSETSWGDPSLSQSAVNAFVNQDKYPFAVGNCCLAADFGYAECIGETWMRAPNKGSVAYIGSSPSSYWFEDFYWAVGAFPIQGNNSGYVPTYEETSWGAYDGPFVSEYVSAGGTVMIGNLAVTEVDIQGYPSHSSPLYYWQAYNVLGDPSIVPYMTEGEINTVSHMPILPIGLNTYEVTALPGSYVSISKDGVLHGAALVGAEGVVEVAIDPVLSSGNVDIIVTKPQFRPYMMQVPAAALVGPYVVLDSYTINDQSGNNNGLADYSETVMLNVTLKNVGADPSAALTATLAGADSYVTLTSAPVQSFDAIANGGTTTVNNAFTFSIADLVPNQHLASFTLSITDGSDTWVSNLRLTIQAPVLEISEEVVVVDNQTGNGDGILDPGETADIRVTLANTGNSAVSNIILSIASSDPLLIVNTTTLNHALLNGQSVVELLFNVTAGASSPIGYPVNLSLSAVAGPSGVYTAEQTAMVVIGLIPDYLMSNGTATTCVGTFYDSGGPNNEYGNNENFTFTFLPTTTGAMIRANFTSFDVENSYEKLYVYNGSDANAPQLPGSPFTGLVGPGQVTALNASGALTFKFTSDGSVTKAGWVANITCYAPSAPPTCASNPAPANNATNVGMATILTWMADDATSYDVYFGSTPNPPMVGTVEVNQYAPVMTPNTTYFWKIVPKNQFGPATGCEVWSFTTGGPEYLMANTTITANNGMFYDTGGENGNYDNSENLTMTFLPPVEGAPMQFVFTAFETENNYDKLFIFNGPDASSPAFPGSPFMGTINPGTITSTHPSGAITFNFTSDVSVVKTGWSASFMMLGEMAIAPAAYPGELCEGNSAMLNANATGGSGSYTYSWSPAESLSDPAIANPLASPSETTTYTVAVSDGTIQMNGEVTIIVHNVTPVDLGQDSTLCIWESITLDASMPNAVSYLWMPGGQTTSSITCLGSEMGLGTHSVSVLVTDANGCEVEDEINVTFDICSSINENDRALRLMIHPNPASNMLNIQLNGNAYRVSYYLMNYQGQILYTSTDLDINGSYINQIDLSGFAKGIYYIRLNTGESTIVRKVVIQ